MMKVGLANARLKQVEVSLDAAQIDKQNAETEAALAKEKVDASKSEVNRIELMVGLFIHASHELLKENSLI